MNDPPVIEYRRRTKPAVYPFSGDRISTLPDDVLHFILSLLSFKESVRTSILSHRWRHLWYTNPSLSLSIPLKIFQNDPNRYSSIVDSCLSACASNNNLLSMSLHVDPYSEDESRYHRWIDFAAVRSVKSLFVLFHYMEDEDEDVDEFEDFSEEERFVENFIDAPIPIFSVSTLNFLHLYQCVMPYILGRSCFPNLETLILERVVINKQSSTRLLSISPQLKNFKLGGLWCEGQIVIECPTLETLDVYQNLFKVMTNIKILNVPKLRVLTLCCDLEMVDLGGLNDSTDLGSVVMFCNPERDFWYRDPWIELVSGITGAKTLVVDYWLLEYSLRDEEDFVFRPPIFSNLRELHICGGPFANTWFPAIVKLLRECPLLENFEIRFDYAYASSIDTTHHCDEIYIREVDEFENDDIIREFSNCTDIAQNLRRVKISGHDGYRNIVKLMYLILSHAYKLEEVDITTDTESTDADELDFGILMAFEWVSSLVKIYISKGRISDIIVPERWVSTVPD